MKINALILNLNNKINHFLVLTLKITKICLKINNKISLIKIRKKENLKNEEKIKYNFHHKIYIKKNLNQMIIKM